MSDNNEAITQGWSQNMTFQTHVSPERWTEQIFGPSRNHSQVLKMYNLVGRRCCMIQYSLTYYSCLRWGCKIIPMWKSMRGEETVTQRANHMSYHVTMSFHFSCRCRGRQAIVIWKSQLPDRSKIACPNAIETAIGIVTLKQHSIVKQRSNDFEKAFKWKWNYIGTALKRPSNNAQLRNSAQTSLKRTETIN